MPSSRGLPNSGIEPRSPTLQVNSLPSEPEIETHRRREQIYGHQRGMGDAGMNWEIVIDIHTLLCIKWASLVAQMVKRPSAMQETRV